MTSNSTPPREAVEELLSRLSRLGAASVTLGTAAAAARPGTSVGTLTGILDDLNRDLVLASRELARVRHDLHA